MNKQELLRYGLPIAGAIAVAFAAIAVTASAAGLNLNLTGAAAATPKPSASPGSGPDHGGKADMAAYCAAFMKNFAGDLNVSQDAVDAAAKKAAGQTIDQAVADGKMTADQAAKVKAAIPTGALCASIGNGLPGHGRGDHGAPGVAGPAHGELGAYLGAYLDAAAKAAGLKGGAEELKKDMAAGQTLSTIAKANGIDEPTFRKNLIANLTPALDAAVAAGKLTADQEKKILAGLQTGPIPQWNSRPGPKGPPPGAGPAPPPA